MLKHRKDNLTWDEARREEKLFGDQVEGHERILDFEGDDRLVEGALLDYTFDFEPQVRVILARSWGVGGNLTLETSLKRTRAAASVKAFGVTIVTFIIFDETIPAYLNTLGLGVVLKLVALVAGTHPRNKCLLEYRRTKGALHLTISIIYQAYTLM